MRKGYNKRIFVLGILLTLVIANLSPSFADSKFVRNVEINEKLVIFLHGFTGDYLNTWENFPALLEGDQILAHFDILMWGYPSNLFSFNPSIETLGRYIAERIEGLPERYKSLVIVAHSMGGLVSRAAVTSALTSNKRHSLLRLKKLILFGTPNEGAEIAKLTSFWNQQGQEMEPSSEFIEELNDDWISLSHDFNLEIPTTVLIGLEDSYVKPESAKSYFTDVRIVEGNHVSMVKPSSRNHISYHTVKNILLEKEVSYQKFTGLSGIVREVDNGVEIGGASVVLLGESSYETKPKRTDDDGYFSFQGLAMGGSYELKISHPDFFTDIFKIQSSKIEKYELARKPITSTLYVNPLSVYLEGDKREVSIKSSFGDIDWRVKHKAQWIDINPLNDTARSNFSGKVTFRYKGSNFSAEEIVPAVVEFVGKTTASEVQRTLVQIYPGKQNDNDLITIGGYLFLDNGGTLPHPVWATGYVNEETINNFNVTTHFSFKVAKKYVGKEFSVKFTGLPYEIDQTISKTSIRLSDNYLHADPPSLRIHLITGER